MKNGPATILLSYLCVILSPNPNVWSRHNLLFLIHNFCIFQIIYKLYFFMSSLITEPHWEKSLPPQDKWSLGWQSTSLKYNLMQSNHNNLIINTLIEFYCHTYNSLLVALPAPPAFLFWQHQRVVLQWKQTEINKNMYINHFIIDYLGILIFSVKLIDILIYSLKSWKLRRCTYRARHCSRYEGNGKCGFFGFIPFTQKALASLIVVPVHGWEGHVS